ncbi:MAG: hypothetical protein Q3974_02980 [Rothia sp. (in: high G+C Gram-positive bacteria)]|nr:hypothetical protein [Rothia sp. (in: high G+C Gram-positive bacteria)]
MSNQPNTSSSATPTPPSNREQLVTIRRAPSLLAFAITGGVMGLLLATILTFISSPDPVQMYTDQYSRMAVFGVLAVVGTALGVALALIIALLLDRRSAKNPETVRAIETDDE